MAITPKVICAVVAIFLELLVLLFVILGAALNLFEPDGAFGAWWGSNTCYTMWGIAYCSNHKRMKWRDNAWKGFPCKATRDHINAAGAFTIFAIFLAIATLGLTVLVLPGFLNQIFAMLAGILCCGSILIAWACAAGGFHHSCGSYWDMNVGPSLSDNFHLSDAFGLLVAAWILQIIQTVLLFFSGSSPEIHAAVMAAQKASA